jgi:F-type H+-transporting ATPase subunit beta
LNQGSHSIGALQKLLKDLVSTITFDPFRAKEKLRPAIDPLRSTSNISSEILDEVHNTIAARACSTLAQHNNLQYIPDGFDGLKISFDRLTVERARKLHCYLTQPFPGAEPWIGIPGQNFSIMNTLTDCKAILDCNYDTIPVESHNFLGQLSFQIKGVTIIK